MSRPARRHAILLALAFALALPAPVRADAGGADRAVAAARKAASENRNTDAARLFEDAIARDPAHADQWKPELAEQLTWAGQPERAIPIDRELLASGSLPPDVARRIRLGLALALSWNDEYDASLREYDALLAVDGGDTEAMLGRARVLSWQDRLGPSKKEYERVLAKDPGNAEARRGLARAQSWRGMQLDAQGRLGGFLQQSPDDAEAAFLLAQSQDWIGRPDRAEETLRARLAKQPDDARSKALLDDIEFRQRPDTRFFWTESHQSDKLVIDTLGVEHNVRFNDGRTTIGPRYTFTDYDPSLQQGGRILVSRPGLYARHRFTDRVEWTGQGFVDLIQVKSVPFAPARDHAIFTYDTWFTLWPHDKVRVYVGSNRTTFDNAKSLQRGIAGTFANLSADFIPDEKTRLTGRINWGDFTDGNSRTWGQAEFERRVWNHPKLFAGWRYTTFDFTKELDNGYFNPNTYNANAFTLRTTGDIRRKLTYNFDGYYGVEDSNPGDDQVIWGASSNVTWSPVRRVEFQGGYGYFSSSTASSGGFSRGTALAGLRFVW